MAYLVLARKYRSRTFEEVIGQEHIARTLVNAIGAGRVAHAYLFTGTRGVGKTTMARIFAKALNCLSVDEPTTEPCNECEACVAIGRGDDIDVVEIDGASNTGVEDVRNLRANVIYRPSRSRYKVYYIDEVHMLSTAAFNALLKTLEEPPEHVKFIFSTTEVQKIPATILSRCQRFDFRNIPTQRIADHLRWLCEQENVEADDEAVFRIARAAAGSMRDGLSLLDQLLSTGDRVTDEQVVNVLGTPPDERVLAIALAVADGDAAAALAELSAVLEGGVTLSSAAAAMGNVFRHLMLAATCGADSELIELPESQREQVRELAGRFSVPSLVHAMGMLQALSRNVRTSSIGRGMVEAVLVRLAAADKFVDPESLIERLEAAPSAPPAGRVPPPSRRGPAARPSGEKKKPSPVAAAPAGDEGPREPSPRDSGGSGNGAYETEAQGESPPAPEPAPRPALSTDERNEIARDPAVREVLELFGGSVVDFRRETPSAEADEDGGEGPEAS